LIEPEAPRTMATLIVGNDNANTLSGTGGDDVIYGFNPNGPQKTVTSIDATGDVFL
jgi:hypothetical protein